jgi:transposase-like protein
LYGAPVPRPDFPGTIMEFQERFSTETACLEYLAASRWPEGFVCPGCGGRRAWVLQRRHLWECGRCHAQTSVTAGTVMRGTRMPLRLWFWAAYLVATHHRGISAKQLQRQLGLSRYETAWLILQKLRRALVAPEREPLKDEVEVDEFYLGGEEEGLKGGRQRGKKALVGIAIEARGAGSGRVRLQVLRDLSAESLGPFVKATTSRGAIVHTDGWKGYNGLSKLGYRHRPHLQGMVAPGEQPLPRAHRAVSNLKAWMHGTHRGVGDPHLQVYLDEYVFRHNRRATPMAAFQTLLGLGTRHPPTTYNQITRHDQIAA